MKDFLHYLLEINFKALGFELVAFGELPLLFEHSDYYMLYGSISCPCGGQEQFSCSIKTTSTTEEIRYSANLILRRVASRQHLEEDVANGTLKLENIECHVFKELILE